MLSGIAANVLSKYLGDYIEGSTLFILKSFFPTSPSKYCRIGQGESKIECWFWKCCSQQFKTQKNRITGYRAPRSDKRRCASAVRAITRVNSVIRTGYLGKLELRVPWQALGSKPTIVKIDQVFLIVSPKPKSAVRENFSPFSVFFFVFTLQKKFSVVGDVVERLTGDRTRRKTKESANSSPR